MTSVQNDSLFMTDLYIYVFNYVIKQYISMTTYSVSRKRNTDNTIMIPQQ
jgi:hypothetical protein